MKLYGKFVVQVLATALVALIAALQDDRVDAAEWINVVLAALTAVAVLGAGNTTEGVWRYTKVIVASAGAGLTLLASFVSDGGVVTVSEWLQVLVAALGAAGVLVVKGPRLTEVNVSRDEHGRPKRLLD
jgi:drug/metabolite transporter (DMT)-like permease